MRWFHTAFRPGQYLRDLCRGCMDTNINEDRRG